MSMRWIAIFAQIILCGCATAPLASLQDEASGRSLSVVRPELGALYVYRSSAFGPGILIYNFLDGRPLGALPIETWLRVELSPALYAVNCRTQGSSETVSVKVEPGEVHFIEVGARFGPRCYVTETNAAAAQATINTGRRVAAFAPALVTRSPTGPIQIVYKDSETNVIRLQGTAQYGAVVGRSKFVPFTILNENGQPACSGQFETESTYRGKFTFSCAGGLSAGGLYQREQADGLDQFVGRGTTGKGLPVTLVVGRPLNTPDGV